MRTRTTISIFTFLILFITACSSDDEVVTMESGFPEIVGDWKWIGTTGGLAGASETPESLGITRDITITETDFIFFIEEEIFAERAYTLSVEESETTGLTEFIVTFEDNGFRDIVRREDDIINFIDDCDDCYTSVYQLKN